MRIPSRRPIAALLLSLALAACEGPFNRPPPQLYVLSPKSTFDTTLPDVEWQLSVDVPVAEAGINTSRIAVRRGPARLDFFEGVNWSDVAPRLVQTMLVESFENSRRIIGVGRQNVALRADYSLASELREFQAETIDAQPRVRVRLNAKLIKLPRRVIVAATSAEAVVPAKGDSVDDFVAAFDQALGKVLKSIVTWALREGERDHGAAGSRR